MNVYNNQPIPISLAKHEILWKNKSYYIIKRAPISISENELNTYKRYYNADIVLKKQGFYHFCSEIEEAVIIWEDKHLGDEVFRVNYLPETVYKKRVQRLPNKSRKMSNKHKR